MSQLDPRVKALAVALVAEQVPDGIARGRGPATACRPTGSTAASIEAPPSYDSHQLSAVLLSWTCCRRTVYATNPAYGCLQCR